MASLEEGRYCSPLLAFMLRSAVLLAGDMVFCLHETWSLLSAFVIA